MFSAFLLIQKRLQQSVGQDPLPITEVVQWRVGGQETPYDEKGLQERLPNDHG